MKNAFWKFLKLKNVTWTLLGYVQSLAETVGFLDKSEVYDIVFHEVLNVKSTCAISWTSRAEHDFSSWLMVNQSRKVVKVLESCWWGWHQFLSFEKDFAVIGALKKTRQMVQGFRELGLPELLANYSRVLSARHACRTFCNRWGVWEQVHSLQLYIFYRVIKFLFVAILISTCNTSMLCLAKKLHKIPVVRVVFCVFWNKSRKFLSLKG